MRPDQHRMEPLKPDLSHYLIIDDRHISRMHQLASCKRSQAFQLIATIN